MLISFAVENWASIAEEVELDLQATKERRHAGHITRLNNDLKVLPIAAIFGANASGKSNFIDAIRFLTQFIQMGLQPGASVPVRPHKLRSTHSKLPSKFRIVFSVDSKTYEYVLHVSDRGVVFERLSLRQKNSSKIFFERIEKEFTFGKMFTGSNRQLLPLIARTTRENQAFLNSTYTHEFLEFKALTDWLVRGIRVIQPDSTFLGTAQLLSGGQLFDRLNVELENFGTGIKSLSSKLLSATDVQMPSIAPLDIQNKIPDGVSIKLPNNVVMGMVDGQLEYRKIGATHQDELGNPVDIDMEHESDGTRRLIDLFPAFFQLEGIEKNVTYVVDELDRSLHSLATEALLEMFLVKLDPQNRNQLIFTTHDTQLLTQRIFRRDELWAIQRNNQSASELFSFSEFEGIRYDADIRKMYLGGQLGGIPRIVI